MQHHEIEPPESLRDLIQCFWYTRKEFAESPASFDVLPDGYAEIIFHFGSSLTTGSGQPLASPFMVGLLNQPACFYAKSQIEVIGIRCFPWTIFELLGLPPGQDGVRFLAHPIAQLQAPLAASLAQGDVVAALTEAARYFEQGWPRPAPDRTLGKAGGAMRAAGGTLPVTQVAAAAHATVRTLERKFKQAAGYTVKDVSGLLRFEQVCHHLWRHPAANLAGLAQELGYTDQSHLGREFKRYCGTTPAAFARKALRWQQAAGADFVAFVLS